MSGLLGWGRMTADLCGFAGSVPRGFAIPDGLLAPASHPLGRLPPVVILASRPRLPAPRWRLWAPEYSRGLVGCFRRKGVVTVASGGPLVPVFLGWRPSLPVCNPWSPCVPVVGGLSSALLPGFIGPESSVLPVDLPPSAPFVLGVLLPHIGFMVPLAVSGTREVGLPGVRRTASPYSVQLQCVSVAADQILGLAYPCLLAPLHTPI